MNHFSGVFEDEGANVESPKVIDLLDDHFEWCKVGFNKPTQKRSLHSIPYEFKLIYRKSKHLNSRPHLIVKKSTIPKIGYGLFADRTFSEGDVISVYLGEKKNMYICSNKYTMYYSSIEGIDAGGSIKENDIIYLGAHFANG